ncbi:MAG: cysteine desulfurase family protein [Myxococcales bacterium]|nr:cysteine desulfurase [Myxococcales bacterium]HIK85289.1 cysteine desulfurase [Myxococcales bacterium]
MAAGSPSRPDRPIYLDHHATTPLDPRVLEAMLPYLQAEFGNAASTTHVYGWRAEAAVEDARERLAEMIGASSPSEIVFTSGATESNNLAILGLADSQSRRRHIVTVETEHPSVLDTCRALARRGFELTELAVDANGLVSPEAVAIAIREETVLVSIMAANNEIGVLQPITEIADLCRDRDIAFHSDAAQAVGKIAIDVEAQRIDLLSVSGHKLYGPKGIGFLRIRRSGKPRLTLEPRQYGGGHEGGLRSGTLPVASIVGFARALECCLEEREAEAIRLAKLRDQLRKELEIALPGRVLLNGDESLRLPGNLNLSFQGVDGDRLMADLSGIAISSGSACSSAQPGPSHVILALGREPALAKASLRFGFGRGNTPKDVSQVAERVVAAIRVQLGE